MYTERKVKWNYMRRLNRWLVVLLVVVLLLVSGCSADGEPMESVASEIRYLNPDEYDSSVLRYDAVVVGAGVAGFSAAVMIAEAGYRVVVIEKMPFIGGNCLYSEGTLNAVDPIRQGAQGIEDSVELFIMNTYVTSGMQGNLDLITILCENACDARNWISEHGGTWDEGNIYLTTGGKWPRSLDAANNAYDTYIYPLATAVTQMNGDIIVNMKAESLIVENGVVVGVEAVSMENGKSYKIYGEKGVVLATGGYGSNMEMIQEYCSYISESVESETMRGATGDGILMAQSIGADTVDMKYVQMELSAVVDGMRISNEVGNAIYVNKEGQRFVAEDADRSEVCQALLEQTDGIAYVIFDSNTIHGDFTDSLGRSAEDLKKLVEEGLIGYGETIGELAQSLGIDAAALQNTIDLFNLMVDGELVDPYGRELFYRKLGDGPYYASIRTAKIHYTMGGLKIDIDAHVINTNGEIIEGLYACGEVTGGIHGTNHVGGNALADCVVFGRIAGKNIANS